MNPSRDHARKVLSVGIFIAPLLQLLTVAIALGCVFMLSERLATDEAVIKSLVDNQVLTTSILGNRMR